MKRISKNSGMTIIESLLYLSLLTIMIGSMALFVNMSIYSRVKGQVIGDIEYSGSFALDIINYNLKNAETITTPTIGNSGSSLTLTKFNSDIINFRLNAGKIEMQINSDAYQAITPEKILVSDLSFRNVAVPLGNNDSVETEFNMNYINNSGRNEYTFSKYFKSSTSLRL